MSSPKKIRFIINPKSGTSSKTDLAEFIRSWNNEQLIDYDLFFTEAPLHAKQLSQEAKEKGYDFVAVAGGDGTVNEAAGALLHSTTSLAILPSGSGNGLARHLGIPVDSKKALALISNGHIEAIDTFTAGSHIAIGTFGIGFDAHIAHLFSKSSTRGYSTYVKLVLSEFAKYPPQKIAMTIDGKPFLVEAFLMTFANSSQFGNNAVIAPFADITDGKLDVSVMKPFPWFVAPSLIYRLTHNTLHQSKYYIHQIGREIHVSNNGNLKAHIDGEPVEMNGDFNVHIVPQSLKIVLPSNAENQRK